MRQLWLKENKRLVSQDNFGNDLAAVEAAMKKHEAIESDIFVSLAFRSSGFCREINLTFPFL